MPKFSIIVPAYNVEKYVEKCIRSILNQTYIDFEVLLIDDGSTDSTPQLCDKLASLDKRIRVFHKNNGGLSDARNYGLDRINGEYITFVDSDDLIANNFLSFFDSVIISENVDVCISPLKSFIEESELEKKDVSSFAIVTDEIAVKKMLIRDKISHSAGGKIYHRNLWKSMYFPVGKLYEDYMTTFSVMSNATKVAVADGEMYFYLQRTDSIMHYACDERTVAIVDATKEITSQIISSWPRLEAEALDLQIALCLKCQQNILNTNSKEFIDKQNEIKRIVYQNARKVLVSYKVPYKDKIKVICFFLGKKLFKRVYNIFDGRMKLVENS